MKTALQLRGLIANQHQRIAWCEVMLEDFPADCFPRNFHAQCVLARQMLRSFEDELAALNLPAASAARSKSALAGPLVTSGETRPAFLSAHVH